MIQPNSTYSVIMPKVQLTPLKQKTKKEEIKEIIQNPNDPLAKYPLRAFGYSNEVGAAVSAMPVWGKAAESALWVPALMYLGADIYDKYKRGKEGDYTKASAAAAVQQATFQGLASVLLPTAAVKMGQSAVGYMTKYGETKMTASAQEEMYRKLLHDFDKGKFAKGDYIDESGTLVKGFDKVMGKIIDSSHESLMNQTRHDLKTESLWDKTKRFFGHSQRPIASSKTDSTIIEKFLNNKAKDVYEIQNALESGDQTVMDALSNSKIVKKFNKQLAKIGKVAEDILKEDPSLIMKKILNSNDKKLEGIKKEILGTYINHKELKGLVASQKLSREMLDEVMKNADNAKLVNNFAKRIEATRKVMRTYLKGKEMNLGLLKTGAGFAALALLAVPIDHFVHKYIIKMFVEPGLDGAKKLHSKLSFKQSENK